MAGEREAPDAPPGGAAAIVRAMAVLQCFEPGDDDLALGQIAERAGLRVSTAHRIVRALCSGSFMEQDPRSDRYRLGRALVLLGQRAADHLGLDVARPVLESLADRTGESASLGVRHGDEVVVVLVASSHQRLRFDHDQGGRIGLHASAMGKVLLAFGADDPAVAITADAVLEQRSAKRVLVFRPLFAVGGQELGYLPGSELDKMSPWSAAVLDGLESITGPEVIDEVQARGLLEVLPLTHIRGRSLTDSFVIIDEAQNLERPVLLTALSRLGVRSRVVLTHDVAQRDNLRVGRHDGVASVIEALRGHPIFGHVTLTRSERSEIAAVVTELLDVPTNG